MWQRNNSDFYSIRNLSRSDKLTLSYLFIWILLILIFFPKIKHATLFLILHLAAFAISLFLGSLAPKHSILAFVRRWYYFLFILLFFAVLHYLIPSINPGNIDQYLIKFDFLLLNLNPTIWFERFYSPLLTEILLLSYLAFYYMPLCILIPFYKRKEYKNFDRFSFSILLTFYISYIGYLLFPALGPRYFLAHLHQKSLYGIGIYQRISSSLDGLENIQWDAFPSGHVAISLIFALFAAKYFPKTFFIMLPIIMLLIFSTVYLRYHYVVDILAGILLFCVVAIIDKLTY